MGTRTPDGEVLWAVYPTLCVTSRPLPVSVGRSPSYSVGVKFQAMARILTRRLEIKLQIWNCDTVEPLPPPWRCTNGYCSESRSRYKGWRQIGMRLQQEEEERRKRLRRVGGIKMWGWKEIRRTAATTLAINIHLRVGDWCDGHGHKTRLKLVMIWCSTINLPAASPAPPFSYLSPLQWRLINFDCNFLVHGSDTEPFRFHFSVGDTVM